MKAFIVGAIMATLACGCFDLNKPTSQWAQSTGRFLNVTCETDTILIFYMEV